MSEEQNSWLRSNVRPLIALIIILTLSYSMLFGPDPAPWYIKWGGGIVFFYFGARQWEKHKKK